jgi:hypothetical protein
MGHLDTRDLAKERVTAAPGVLKHLPMKTTAPRLPHQDAPTAAFDAALMDAAAVVTVAATVAFALVFWFRAGLEDAPFAVLAMLLSCLLPVWLTALAAGVSAASDATRRMVLSAVLTLSLIFPVAGLALGKYASAAIAIAVLVMLSLRWAHGGAPRVRSLGVLLSSLPLALLLIVIGFPMRLLLPQAMTLGLAPTDSYFHAAIAQMIAQHFIPSTGADGLSYEHYHFASHAVAAGLSKTSGASVALVYAYWGALSLKVQLLWSILLCGMLLSSGAGADSNMRAFPRILYAVLVMIASNSLESESLVLALAIFLGLFPLLCSLTSPAKHARFASTAFIVVAVLTSFICAAAKVSVGFYCAVALLWIAWRQRRNYAILGLALSGVAGLGIVTVLFLSPTDLTLASEALRHIAVSYGAYFIKWTTLLSYAVPVLVIAIALVRPQFSRIWSPEHARWRLDMSLEALRPKLRPWRAARDSFLELEPSAQLMALSLAACVLVLLLIPIGSNMWYFSVVLLVTAGAVLPASLWRICGVEISAAPVRTWLLVAAAGTGLAYAQQFATESAFAITALFRTASAAPRDLASGDAAPNRQTIGIGPSGIAASLRATGTVFGLLNRQIGTLPWASLLRDVREKSAISGGLAVHVLPSADEYWRRLIVGAPSWWCMAGPLMIPAETGILEIRSIEPKAIERECSADEIVWYGFGRHQDLHRTGELSAEQLCEDAGAAHIRNIYMLESISEPNKNKIIGCALR